MTKTKNSSTLPMSERKRPIATATRISEAWWSPRGCANAAGGPNAQGRHRRRQHCHLSSRSAPVYRQADRVADEFRRASRYRYREYATTFRIARCAGTADGDRRCVARDHSSPGELQPVFSVMLENATRICEAKFGVLSLREDRAFRVVAMHNAPPAFMEMRRKDPTFRPSGRMGTLMEQAFSTRRAVQLADIAQHLDGGDDPLTRSFSAATEARSIILVPLVKEDGEDHRFNGHLPPGGSPVRRQAD